MGRVGVGVGVGNLWAEIRTMAPPSLFSSSSPVIPWRLTISPNVSPLTPAPFPLSLASFRRWRRLLDMLLPV